ncbi:DUF2341 domain-containing protein [Methanococcoides alaskense]|uniref:DUF2341 domain-containing protein n=1 Tax=Methanococcoides alaskense TaxID=325778 RepID=A0AA90ZBV2_9EURY|nr:DUF2341 domain-containing protein [Methanococcoides alaskense]MDA0524883.1 DUF2341 domain-containing protein [Methanococcoides alaskense]MDR6222203.1 hypothetical protein [Methanococcoides alaskense]
MKGKIILFMLISIIILTGMTGTGLALSNAGGGDWSYSEEMTIKENSGKDLTNYQLQVLLDPSNFDFSKAKPDGADIRFSRNDQQLSHWIEEWDAGSESAIIWIKVPFIPSNGMTDVTIHYGNPAANDISSGGSTFDLFDDFVGTRLSSTDWRSETNGGGDIDIGNGILSLVAPKRHPADFSKITSRDKFGINSMFVVKRMKVSTGTDPGGPALEQGFVDPQDERENMIVHRTELTNESKVSWTLTKKDDRFNSRDLTNLGIAEKTWYTSGIAWYEEDDLKKVSWFNNGIRDTRMDYSSDIEDETVIDHIPDNELKLYLYSSTASTLNNTGYMDVDYAFVRKYTPQEPTFVLPGEVVTQEPLPESDIQVTQPPVKDITMTAFDGGTKAIFIFEPYPDNSSISLINDLKASGINTVFLRTDINNVWSSERFIKSAHENNMTVHAMILDEKKDFVDGINESSIEVIEEVLDYNTKSLAGFDGIYISLKNCDPVELEQVCQENAQLLEIIHEKTAGKILLAAGIPAVYDRSSIEDIAPNVDLFVLMTHDMDEIELTAEEIEDSVASKMGEIRGAGENALITVVVSEGSDGDAEVDELLNSLYVYYSDDPAFLGVSLLMHEDLQEVLEATAPAEEKRTPGFEAIFAIIGLLSITYRLRKQ